MIKRYRKFVESIYATTNDENLKSEANELLNLDFMKQVENLWEYDLRRGYDKKKQREKLKEIDKYDLVVEYRYDLDKKEFIKDNWDKLNYMILIIQDYIENIEKKEKEQENEV